MRKCPMTVDELRKLGDRLCRNYDSMAGADLDDLADWLEEHEKEHAALMIGHRDDTLLGPDHDPNFKKPEMFPAEEQLPEPKVIQIDATKEEFIDIIAKNSGGQLPEPKESTGASEKTDG